MAKDKLTQKQAAFVAEYLKTGNGTESVRRAGYKGNDVTLGQVAAENLKKPQVLRAIQAAQAKRNERLELEEDFELKKGLELLRMCMEPKQKVDLRGAPVFDDEGNMVLQFDSKGANMALQTIAKLRGKFIQKVEVGIADNLAADLEDLDK